MNCPRSVQTLAQATTQEATISESSEHEAFSLLNRVLKHGLVGDGVVSPEPLEQEIANWIGRYVVANADMTPADYDPVQAQWEAPREPPEDESANAAWLTQAHMLCADQGIHPGHISDRIEALRVKLGSGK